MSKKSAKASERRIQVTEGDRDTLVASPKSLRTVLATLKPLDEGFPPIHDLPPDPVDF